MAQVPLESTLQSLQLLLFLEQTDPYGGLRQVTKRNRGIIEHRGSHFIAQFKSIMEEVVFRNTICLLYDIFLDRRDFPLR